MLYRDYGKRITDVVLALSGFILAAPIMLIAGIAIRVTMGQPILYRQARTGHQGVVLEVLKLRTMANAVEANGANVPDAARMTHVGRLLRRWSIDELPQLWNVLRGEMSMVGPRPLLPRYEPFYTPIERMRFTVRPGITGWAQVNGRNDSPWDDRLRHDVWYVEHLSLALDLRILLLTMRRLVTGEGLQVDSRSSLQDLDQVRGQAMDET